MSRILVVDDDETLSDVVVQMLQRANFDAIRARDAESGFEKALKCAPGLLILDLRLPGMGGAELVKRLRAAGIVAPIVILTGVGDEVDKVVLLELGANDFITKPFSPREVISRIRQLLRRPHKLQQAATAG